MRKKLRLFFNNAPLNGALLYFFAVCAIFFGVGRLLPVSIWTEIIFRFALFVLIVFFLHTIFGWTLKDLGFSTKGMGVSIYLSWSEWIKVVIYVSLLVTLAHPQAMHQLEQAGGASALVPTLRGVAKNLAALTPQKLAVTRLFGGSVGLFEETFFRLGLVNQLRLHFGDGFQRAWCTVLISGGLFAALHFMNALNQPLSLTVMQVLQAFGTGVLWGAIYWRSGNAVVPVILHSLTDILILTATAGTSASAAASFGASAAYMGFDFALAAIYLRPKKTRHSGIQAKPLWYNDPIEEIEENEANFLK